MRLRNKECGTPACKSNHHFNYSVAQNTHQEQLQLFQRRATSDAPHCSRTTKLHVSVKRCLCSNCNCFLPGLSSEFPGAILLCWDLHRGISVVGIPACFPWGAPLYPFPHLLFPTAEAFQSICCSTGTGAHGLGKCNQHAPKKIQ